jgi:hypothetical protein
MSRICRTHGGEEEWIVFRWESQKERDYYEDLDLGGWIILKRILEKQDGIVWTEFIWLSIGTSGRLL